MWGFVLIPVFDGWLHSVLGWGGFGVSGVHAAASPRNAASGSREHCDAAPQLNDNAHVYTGFFTVTRCWQVLRPFSRAWIGGELGDRGGRGGVWGQVGGGVVCWESGGRTSRASLLSGIHDMER